MTEVTEDEWHSTWVDTKRHKRIKRSKIVPSNGTLELRDYLDAFIKIKNETSRKMNTTPTLTFKGSRSVHLYFGLLMVNENLDIL